MKIPTESLHAIIMEGRTKSAENQPPNKNVLIRDHHTKCELDNRKVLSLEDILNSFHAPVSEEYAWALIYQCAKCGQGILESDEDRELCHLVTQADQLLIHKDGQIHMDTFVTRDASSQSSGTTVSTNSSSASSSSAVGKGSGSTKENHEKGPPRIKSTEECKIISKLAIVIFSALDYGLTGDEERPLSADLESLLDAMGAADESAERSETDDEGIERDSGDSDTDDRSPGPRSFTFSSIIELCTRRLGSSILSTYNGNQSDAAADKHYKAVCRGLVAEALELSSFLQKVSEGTHQLRSSSYTSSGSRNIPPLPDPDLDKLQFTDWARLWVQVIRELRDGVKLKKVDFSRGPPIEYELTPYEILMDDIRSRRYKLNKVTVDGTLPHRIKKDAHAIILEFIRGRPPLKKVTDRVLGPAPKPNVNPVELLMESIREHHLKPTNKRRDSARNRARRIHATNEMIDTSTSANNNKSSTSSHISTVQQPPQTIQQQHQRRLIKADFEYLYSLNTKDDDDDDEDDAFEDSPSDNFFGHICPEATQSTPASPWNRPTEPQFEKCKDENLDLRRRHSICNPTSREEYGSTLVSFPFEYTNSLQVFNNLNSRTSPILQRRNMANTKAKLPHSMSKSSLQEEFFQSNHWQTLECLSLNLEEVVHIRNVLTKAELEGLPVDCSLKEDVEKGKVCFLCMKTRFSRIFGPWGNTCKLCKRTICAKCCSRMRIPKEHFAKVPVSTLSPNLSPREEKRSLPGSSMNLEPNSADNSLTLNTDNLRKNSVGSAPTSPNALRRSGCDGADSDSDKQSKSPALTDEERDTFSPDHHFGGHGPRSLPTVQSISLGVMAFKRSFVRNREEEKTEKLKGQLMVVCHDCRIFIKMVFTSKFNQKS